MFAAFPYKFEYVIHTMWKLKSNNPEKALQHKSFHKLPQYVQEQRKKELQSTFVCCCKELFRFCDQFSHLAIRQ